MNEDIIQEVAKRTKGEIYLGVVGAVRSGKSTFIRRFMEQKVLPLISDQSLYSKIQDELPQSADGKTIMTVEPKFIPSNNIKINMGEDTNFYVRLVDCVGYVIPSAKGYQNEDGSSRTIKTPWSVDEIPFEEPKGWTWCRINEIAVDMADGPFGSNLKSEHYTTNREARIIQLSNLSDEGWREENTRYTTIKHATENISRSIVEPGNIVIAKMMPAGRAIICPDKEQMYVLSSDCVKLVPIEGVYKKFLVRALNSPFFRNRVVDNVQGVTRQRTSISKLRSCYFPLPPFEEQKRIVDKLEQVFQQLDILEKSLGE